MTAGFGISESTAHAYTSAVIHLLKILREAAPDFLADGTLAECNRVGNSRADRYHKRRRHGVKVRVVTDPDGRLLEQALAWQVPTLARGSAADRLHPAACTASRETLQRSELAGHAGYGYCRNHSRFF